MMLVLSRKVNERIKIGENIYITVIEVRGAQCRLGIAAPDDVKIMRPEVIGEPRTSSATIPGNQMRKRVAAALARQERTVANV